MAARPRKKYEPSERDVHNILHLIYQDGYSTWSVALGYPLTSKQVYDIALGRIYRMEGYPYLDNLPDNRTPEQKAKSAALPGKLVALAEESGVSLTRLWFVIGRLKNEQLGKARAALRKPVRKPKKLPTRGANERFILDAYNGLVLNPDSSLTEVEVVDRAIAIRGEPTERKARNNMKTNFIRAVKALCRREILLSMDGRLSLYERVCLEDEKTTSDVSA